jgi:tRNA-specific adenosine deaminase 3
LRRLVTRQHLPTHLRASGDGAARDVQTIFLLLASPRPNAPEAIVAILKPHIQDADHLPKILSTHIPLHPPISAEQAATWSQNYWPCTYNPASQTIQNAPPLQLLRTVQVELDTDYLDDCMQLAELVAQECKRLNIARQVGAVVVDPVRQEVVAVAGDARRWTPGLEQKGCDYWGSSDGRPEHHALMRAIAMVADKELERRRSGEGTKSHTSAATNNLGGRPLTDTEKFYFAPSTTQDVSRLSNHDIVPLPRKQSSFRPETYLCSGLDVYLTHEPCVCCAMAMIHSRFRACVFGKRMPGTGGLCAEKADGGLGYGLFWRRELNWRVMTFEYSGDWKGEDSKEEDDATGEKMEIFDA